MDAMKSDDAEHVVYNGLTIDVDSPPDAEFGNNSPSRNNNSVGLAVLLNPLENNIIEDIQSVSISDNIQSPLSLITVSSCSNNESGSDSDCKFVSKYTELESDSCNETSDCEFIPNVLEIIELTDSDSDSEINANLGSLSASGFYKSNDIDLVLASSHNLSCLSEKNIDNAGTKKMAPTRKRKLDSSEDVDQIKLVPEETNNITSIPENSLDSIPEVTSA